MTAIPSHCVPNPPFPSWGIPTPRVDASTVTIQDSISAGQHRGIAVFLHETTIKWPIAIPANNIALQIQALSTALQADGWAFAWPALPMDFPPTASDQTPTNDQWMANAAASDPAHGALYYAQIGLWWDHLMTYLAGIYGTGRPILVIGYSLGAYHAAVVAATRTSTVVGAVMHCLPTIWSNITAFAGSNWGSVDWSGMNLGQHHLDSISIPTVIGTSTADTVVGYDLLHTPASNAYLIASNAAAAGKPCTNYQQASPQNHLLYGADSTFYCTPSTGWVQTTIDPSCPKNF